MTPEEELKTDRKLHDRLPRAWPAFFQRFGRLTSVQRATIPPVLDGRNVLVCSATASGKTEAACAPLVERHIDRPDRWTVLYVSPTRALVNDLFERLDSPVRSLGLSIGRRTGEHKTDLDPAPNILLTTPESFDSLLCRGARLTRTGHPLAGVVAVILDEVHLLHGTPRGEQVRWLIERLRRLRRQAVRKGWTRDSSVQVLALSATVPDPRTVLDAYTPAGEAVIVAGGRAIEVVAPAGGNGPVEQVLPEYIASLGAAEKILVFCNRRRRVDELASALAPSLAALGYRSGAHHGSLAQSKREDVEQALRSESRMVVFATSTLEIGVDIGDVDLVVLDGPAPDIPALLQRIGRGNRRTGTTRVMPCAADLGESILHAAMIDAARAGWLGPVERGPQHAVVRQQILSYVYQAPRRARPRSQIAELLQTCAEPIARESVLDSMIDRGELVEDGDGIRLGAEALDAADRGEVHANIEGGGGAAVVDADSGRSVAVGVTFRGGRGMRLGGELLNVRSWDQWKVEVRRVADRDLASGDWTYAVRPWMKGAGQPQAVRRFLGIREDEWPVLATRGGTFVFHFGGARTSAVINLILSRQRLESVPTVDEWSLRWRVYPGGKPEWLVRTGPAVLDLAITDALPKLERTLARPIANRSLPLHVRLDEVRRWLDLTGELERIRGARWVPVEQPEIEAALAAVCGEGDAGSRQLLVASPLDP